jgi:uncharacterized membrane protein
MILDITVAIDALSIFILFAYHLVLYRIYSRAPEKTHIGKANLLRGLWVESIMTEGKGILAVQTLRNWTMASTFLASTAILISLGALSHILGTNELSSLSSQLSILGPTSEKFASFKLLIISITLFIAFFNFSLAIRYYNNAGFLINVPADKYPEGADIDPVTTILNQGAVHYNLGMRAYYLTAPLTLWLLGPVWFLVGTLFISYVMYRMDYWHL